MSVFHHSCILTSFTVGCVLSLIQYVVRPLVTLLHGGDRVDAGDVEGGLVDHPPPPGGHAVANGQHRSSGKWAARLRWEQVGHVHKAALVRVGRSIAGGVGANEVPPPMPCSTRYTWWL